MKKIFRYTLIYFPFVLGMILFLFNVVNLFSSLCLFLGGYIAIKNTFDYRLVKKNREYFKENNYHKNNNDDVLMPKKFKSRKRERVRVRKK